ncbi:cysteine-rich venom protein TEL1-like [Pecten maximus]|uniref:cysteine-rich venom protein TEL1-like n=1 Tax=Pecten maximus TaxID=6579 RepID=UPI0014590D30|nr:cysteine-rich venom protein TEL1-like [Pecten maximus]
MNMFSSVVLLCVAVALGPVLSASLDSDSNTLLGTDQLPDTQVNNHGNAKYPVRNPGVSDADKKDIVELHNDYRRLIGRDAANMMKVIWDDGMASSAQRHAETCSFDHDHLANRWTNSLPGVYIGQNMCAGNNNWRECVAAWYAEKDSYQYGEGAKTLSWNKIGHFTQLVTWHVSRVGCGYAECEGRKDRSSFVCNYAYGQFYDDVIRPFLNGTSCGACPHSCNDGLCDCAGKICNNFGTLDLNTCTCNCLKFYTGDTCETILCDETEHASCDRHAKDECTNGVNIAALCPHHCGRC